MGDRKWHDRGTTAAWRDPRCPRKLRGRWRRSVWGAVPGGAAGLALPALRPPP